jgi:hypothetical protein
MDTNTETVMDITETLDLAVDQVQYTVVVIMVADTTEAVEDRPHRDEDKQ